MPSLSPLAPKSNRLVPGAPLTPNAALEPGSGPALTRRAEDATSLAVSTLSEWGQTLVALAELAYSSTVQGGTWPSLGSFPSAATFPSVRDTVTTPGPVLVAQAEGDGALTLTPLAEN